MKISNNFAALIEAFFTDRLMRQRKVSPHTISAYRDTFCLLLRFSQERLKKTPSSLTLDDLNASFIISFLDYLENDRGNSARSRNARLAAIHSFFRYIALYEPEKSDLIRRVLAIPNKRYTRVQVVFLTEPETNAILAAPDINTWIGRSGDRPAKIRMCSLDFSSMNDSIGYASWCVNSSCLNENTSKLPLFFKGGLGGIL